MVPGIRALDVHPENLGFIPSKDGELKTFELHFQDNWPLMCTLENACGAQIYKEARHSHTLNKKKILKSISKTVSAVIM